VELLATPSQTVGPFFNIGLVGSFGPELVSPDTPGAIRIRGRVLDGASDPVLDALIELWLGDSLGRSETTDEGRFAFVATKPPADGGAPHLRVGVFARGLLKGLVTRIYFPDEAEANAADPVLAALGPERRQTLVAIPDADGLRFDIHLQGERQTAFFAP
jgi:protocatechuate 3,4-dioxygenase, alpha subunit